MGGPETRPEPAERLPRASLSYKEALDWLYGLQRFGIKLGLENIQRLIVELGIDLAGPRVIHVAGTNGKGSVCAMIDSIARVKGYRTGLFTSPHLISFRERIRINGEMISDTDVALGLTKIRALITNWAPPPTFFEVVTALALQHFAGNNLDIIILETGLGGRLDATNAVQSSVSVLTAIDLDHQKWLGDSIEQIAGEKAGIIKPNTPVISAPQPFPAEGVIEARTTESKAPFQLIYQRYGPMPVGLHGAHQKQNAAIAVAALRAARIDIDESAITRGLLSVEWPARFQRWDHRTIIDGAHNPMAARALADTWRETFGGQRTTLVLAVLDDKDLRGICEALAPISGHAILPRIRSERATNPQELAKIFLNLGVPCQIGGTVGEALQKARAREAPILITGSLHFAGEALAHLEGRPAAFEECAQ
ncbi:MAG: folylpolyglutamate synthase/dihydrofolate synthase family protein [Chthoniobacterales bacterium]